MSNSIIFKNLNPTFKLGVWDTTETCSHGVCYSHDAATDGQNGRWPRIYLGYGAFVPIPLELNNAKNILIRVRGYGVLPFEYYKGTKDLTQIEVISTPDIAAGTIEPPAPPEFINAILELLTINGFTADFYRNDIIVKEIGKAITCTRDYVMVDHLKRTRREWADPDSLPAMLKDLQAYTVGGLTR